MCADGNLHAFYCLPCKKTVSCKHQWLADVKAQCAGRVHLSFEKAVNITQKLDAMMRSSSSSSLLKEQVIRVELFHTNFILHHNLSLLTAEHLPPLYVKMLLDSKVAKNFKCSRIKSTYILNQCSNETNFEISIGRVHDGKTIFSCERWNQWHSN